MKISAYNDDKTSLSMYDLCKLLPGLKKDDNTKWLKEVNSQSLCASLQNLDKAFIKFYKGKSKYPKFKTKKNDTNSFTAVQNISVNFDREFLSIPKIKRIKFSCSRKFEGRIQKAIITRTNTNKYFISFVTIKDGEYPKPNPIDESQAIGIDLGIKTFAVLSNGIIIDNPKYLKKSQNKLKQLQRRLSKKNKGSNSWNKCRLRLAICHEKVKNQRYDFLQKTTSSLIKTYPTICLESLHVKNMVKNHNLARALSDVSFGQFNKMINYKSLEYGVNVLRIGTFEPSSKMCSCGVINNDLQLKDRFWTCNSCGETHDRDLLAANNIKKFAFNNINTVGHTEIYASQT